MNHKLSTFCLLFACFLGLNVSLWGQNAAAKHGIRGYLDPQTGVFHTIPHPELQEDAAPVATTTFTGKIVANFTITIDSTVLSTNEIGCQVSADLEDIGTVNVITEEATNAVKRGTGTTVTCTATIPYSWKLATASTDTISLSYTITSPVGATTLAAEFPLRVSSQTLPSMKVPPTGTTTTLTIAATI